jgi:hypothetical protein
LTLLISADAVSKPVQDLLQIATALHSVQNEVAQRFAIDPRFVAIFLLAHVFTSAEPIGYEIAQSFAGLHPIAGPAALFKPVQNAVAQFRAPAHPIHQKLAQGCASLQPIQDAVAKLLAVVSTLVTGLFAAANPVENEIADIAAPFKAVQDERA